MGKINYYYDPYAAMYANKLSAQADKISGLASQYDTKSPLTDVGKSELQKIVNGRYGDTMLAGIARNSAARDIQAAKDSQGLGTAAMRTGANNSNSLLSHERMLRRTTNDANNRSADLLVRGMPGYVSEVGDWANQDNNLLSQRIAAESGATGAIGNAAGVMAAGTTVKEKKGFWSNLMSGLQSVAGIAAGFGLSDEKAKKNIKVVSGKSATKKIKKTKIHDFEYKEGMGEARGKRTGVLAGEYEDVEPAAVRTRGDGLKTVNHQDLNMTSVAALKETIARVEKLERKMKT
jgi:Chaperone of endosialidase